METSGRNHMGQDENTTLVCEGYVSGHVRVRLVLLEGFDVQVSRQPRSRAGGPEAMVGKISRTLQSARKGSGERLADPDSHPRILEQRISQTLLSIPTSACRASNRADNGQGR